MVILTENAESFPATAKGLPPNYNFEIQKTLRTIKRLDAKKITLQFPDGLLCYAPILIEVIQSHTHADCVILNDVVYGACCVDDSIASADLLVHYGHSCLIPVSEMSTRVLYIFVDIRIDVDHLYDLIIRNFTKTVAIIGTIQFNTAVHQLSRKINKARAVSVSSQGVDDIALNERDLPGPASMPSAVIPQIKPLSAGEVLGCTSPVIKTAKSVIYIGDGRFHLESAMIRNPTLEFYKYCPFSRKLSREFYDFDRMRQVRESEIRKAMDGRSFGIILGTLGRQGNRQVFRNLVGHLGKKYRIYKIVVEEINERILDAFDFVDSFVQVGCPRLSIDWGHNYRKPLLSPFEVYYQGGEYNMDYYSSEGSGPWKNYNNTGPGEGL